MTDIFYSLHSHSDRQPYDSSQEYYLHPGHVHSHQQPVDTTRTHSKRSESRDHSNNPTHGRGAPSVPQPALSESEDDFLSAMEAKKEEDSVTIDMFHVPPSYILHHTIGEGAYGTVCNATHHASGTPVAIKRITPFNHAMFAQRTLREIKLLRHFRHENIISILDMIVPSSFEELSEVYLVQELMETDLHRVIRTQELSDDHCQYFMYQALRGVKALHSANVLHRDLKPSNLLLNGNCDLKICDFGLARSAAAPQLSADGKKGAFLTEYVATRWYRAPEVMLSFQAYTKALDIWSIGCILAEMVNRQPLFPGNDYNHQLSLILSVLGTPTMDDFNEITSNNSKKYLRQLPFWRKQPLSKICPTASPLALDLLKHLLTFSPQKRYTVEQALAHPYFESYHDENDEPGAPEVHPDFFNFEHSDDEEKDKKWREIFKELIWHEIQQPIPDYEEHP